MTTMNQNLIALNGPVQMSVEEYKEAIDWGTDVYEGEFETEEEAAEWLDEQYADYCEECNLCPMTKEDFDALEDSCDETGFDNDEENYEYASYVADFYDGQEELYVPFLLTQGIDLSEQL